MTTLFIIWPIVADDDFRPAYEALTNEAIQTDPDTDFTGQFHMVGSSRLLPEHCEILQNTVADAILYGADPLTLGWEAKIDPE